MRYEKECHQLAELAKRQLNLEKNKAKEDFEYMTTYAIWMKFKEEVNELAHELFMSKYIGYDLIEAELGDTVGCLVGLLAKINQIQRNKFIDTFKVDAETAIDKLNRS